MRLLVVDEDEKSVPHICDDLKDLGHDVCQVSDWNRIADVIADFRPEGILLDLMMPRIGMPKSQCASSYTTGAYLYEAIIQPLCVGIPFVVFSAARLDVTIIRQATDRLSGYPEFRGVLSKGCDLREIIIHLERPLVPHATTSK